MPKTCFIIGPIGETGSAVRENSDDFIKYIVAPCTALKEFDYAPPIRADQLNEPGRITSQVIKLLIEADLVIADLTTNNANVYYELSLRHAVGKPAIHMAAEGTPLSFDVRDNRTIFYTMHSRVAENARNELANQIQQVHKNGYRATNPIVETVGIISLEHSADPNQNALGQLMQAVQGLNGEIKEVQAGMRTIFQASLSRFPEWITYPSATGPTGSTGPGGSSLPRRNSIYDLLGPGPPRQSILDPEITADSINKPPQPKSRT
jgi:hypothetical protein